MTASEAVSLLVTRFPALAEMVDGLDELQELAPPFYAYELFAGDVAKRVHDNSFMNDVGGFIDELVSMKDPLIENVLWVSVLEKIAENPSAATEIKRYLGNEARTMLESVEREFYGRDPRAPSRT
jgi:hypothetical protein